MDLSIIVPVYNVENYIRECIGSIFRQGLDESRFEVIIVNDGTEDHSMEVIQDIIDQHKNISVINQENLSLSVARNNGIAMAKGEYILMIDSDDLLIEHSLKPLLEKALETKADLAVADFIKKNNDEIANFDSIPQKEINYEIMTGEELFLKYLNPYHCHVWCTLYRTEFLTSENIRFYPSIRFQDVPFTHECYLKAKHCLRTNILLNIYREWSGASTANFTKEKAKDFCIALGLTWELISLDGLSAQIKEKINQNLYNLYTNLCYRIITILKSRKDAVEVLLFFNQHMGGIRFTNSIGQRIGDALRRISPYLYIFCLIIRWKNLRFFHHKNFVLGR